MEDYIFVYHDWELVKEETVDPNHRADKSLVTSGQPKLFSHRLQEGRLKKRFTITDVASALNVDPSRVTQFENNTAVPTKEEVQILNEVLDLE